MVDIKVYSRQQLPNLHEQAPYLLDNVIRIYGYKSPMLRRPKREYTIGELLFIARVLNEVNSTGKKVVDLCYDDKMNQPIILNYINNSRRTELISLSDNGVIRFENSGFLYRCVYE